MEQEEQYCGNLRYGIQSNYFYLYKDVKQLPKYVLVLGKYDGEIIENSKGEFEIVTMKGHDF